jgi:hypothetical protein
VQHSQLNDSINPSDINSFGQRVQTEFVEILKSGRYIQATRAFEQRVAGELRQTVEMIAASMNELGIESTRIGQAIAYSETLLDKIALETAKANHKLDVATEILARIEARQKIAGSVKLDRRPVSGLEQRQFVEMTYRQRRTEFVGRETEMAQLQAFLSSDSDFSWWQIAGEGGQGKSRLALHLVDGLDADWDAGFITEDILLKTDWSSAEFRKPTLCVIDYAAAPGKAAAVIKAISTLAARRHSTVAPLEHKLRILVLERVGYSFEHAANTSDGTAMNWLRDAFDGGVTETSVRDTAHRTRNSAVSKPLQLSDLDDFGMRSIVRSWLHYKSGIESSDHMLTEWQEADLLARLRGQSDDPQKQRRNWRPLLAMMFAEVMANSPASTQALAQRDLFGLVSDAFEAEQKAYWKKSADNPLKPAALPNTALNIACIATMIGQIDATRLIDGLEQVGTDIDALNDFYGDLSGKRMIWPASRWDTRPPAATQKKPFLSGANLIC